MEKEAIRFPEQIRKGVALVWYCDICGRENTLNRLLNRIRCTGCGEWFFVVVHIYAIIQKKKGKE